MLPGVHNTLVGLLQEYQELNQQETLKVERYS
jgi:hypothetical protein